MRSKSGVRGRLYLLMWMGVYGFEVGSSWWDRVLFGLGFVPEEGNLCLVGLFCTAGRWVSWLVN